MFSRQLTLEMFVIADNLHNFTRRLEEIPLCVQVKLLQQFQQRNVLKLKQ